MAAIQGTITVDTTSLRNAADTFNSMNSQVQSTVNEMLSLVKALSAQWQGEASSTYIHQFEGVQSDMDQIHAKIAEHASDLIFFADNHERAETTNTATSAGINNNLIV